MSSLRSSPSPCSPARMSLSWAIPARPRAPLSTCSALGITGTNQFERLMSKQTDEEALFGRLDLSSLIPGGVPEEVLEKDQHYQELRRKLETELQTGGPNSASQLADLTAEMEQYRKALAELHSGEPRIITKGKLPDSHIVF